MRESCLKGKHHLVSIYRAGFWDDSEEVIRWCDQCGAVVLDIDYDGRTNPGHIKLCQDAVDAIKENNEHTSDTKEN